MVKIKKLNNKKFLSCLDLSREEIIRILDLANDFKNNNLRVKLEDKVLGLIFDKASTRTRVSFQVAMSRLGGSTIDLSPSTSQINRGEPIKDTARVLSRYCDALAIRTFKQEHLEEYSNWSTIPIINALTDLEHPCQVLADFLTIKEEFGRIDNLVLTFIGDGNNVANSLILCGSILGVHIKIACPKGFEPNPKLLSKAKLIADNEKMIEITNEPKDAVKDAHILYTDVWSSMGEEKQQESKDKKFEGFTIDRDLLSTAKEEAIVLHCLPAYRGKEITDEIIDCKKSRIFDQAENRLHVQQALLASFLC